MGALAYLPLSAVLFFIGSGLYVYYQHYAALPEGLGENEVLPHFIMTELPMGISGLLVAAILAAAMSTVDSSLNSSATLLLCDVRNRFRKTVSSDRGDLVFLRMTTVVLGIAGIVAGLAMINVKSMLDVWWKISGILSGGTLGLILLARFTSVQGARSTLPAVIAGVLAIAAITIAHLDEPAGWLVPLHSALQPIKTYCSLLMAIVVGTTIVFVLGIVLAWTIGGKSARRAAAKSV
jgi:SSS family solute:Na+ symporter